MNDEEYGSDSYLFYDESGILFESDRWKYIHLYEDERLSENNDIPFVVYHGTDLSLSMENDYSKTDSNK